VFLFKKELVMNKLRLVLSIVVLLGFTQVAGAEEGELGVTLDVTYMSRLMDKGGEYYGRDGAFLQTVDVDLWGSGFSLSVGHRASESSGYVNKERVDYAISYGNSVFDDEAYKTNYKVTTVYHQFPNQSRSEGNYLEYVLALSWDQLLPGGVEPYYTGVYETPAGSGYGNAGSEGFWHQVGLGRTVTLPEWLTIDDSTDQKARLFAEMAFRDGMGGDGVDHDWSHATIGATTAYDLTDGLSLVPGVFYQISMDDSVNEGNVVYGSLSMKYRF
jgi:hypothetical protein